MRVSKKNEAYIVLSDLTPSQNQELSEFFTFDVPGAKFMPMYKNRLWDGKIRLFSPASGEIYYGLLYYVKEFCSRNKIEYIIEEGVENERNIDRESVRKFAESLRPKPEETLLNFVTIKLMQSSMLYEQIVVFCCLLLLRVSH